METPTVHRSQPWSRWMGAAADIQQDLVGFGYHIWRYGDYVEDRFLGGKCIFLFHPDAIEHVLVSHHKQYSKDVVLLNTLKALVGDGLITTSKEDLWTKQRKMLQPLFSRSRVEARISSIVESIDRYLGTMDGQIDVPREMERLSLQVLINELFQRSTLDTEKFIQSIQGIGPDITSYTRFPIPPLWVPTPRNMRLARYLRHLDRQIESIVENIKAPTEDEGFLPLLAKNNNRRQIRDEIMTFLLAGHHTTAATVTFALWLLGEHPSQQQRLSEEVRSVLGDRGRISPSNIHQLTFTKNVIMETLRLYPISFGIARRCVHDDIVEGHQIKKGTTVLMAPYYTHRHPDFWDEPEHFDPDRFSHKLRHKFAYLPFGAGPRICIGNHFALVEAIIILAMIYQRYELFFDPFHKVEIKYHVALGLKELPVQFKRR